MAFREKRAATTIGSKTVGPTAGPRTLYHLARGDDHRGATWHDVDNRAVWLCAYRLHRSGEPDDAFPYFEEILNSGQIWPTEEDYLWLSSDRAAQFAGRFHDDAARLLALARSSPNQEHRALIGGEQDVGVFVEIVETLEETYLALSVVGLDDYTRLVLILAAFFPDSDFQEWQQRDYLPTRPLSTSELCFSILHGLDV